MAQGWFINSLIDNITFFAPVSSASTVVVEEYLISSLNVTAIWALGSWSPTTGYPGVVEFFSDRLVSASTIRQPQTLWLSRTGDYSFHGKETPIADSDAFSYTMNARQLNRIYDLIAKQDLLAATPGGIWRVGSGDQALTPATAEARAQPSLGCGPLRGLDVGDSYIYTTFYGSQVRDLSYTFEADGYVGADLTAFASHLVNSGARRIVSWAWTLEPWSAVVAARADGVMLSMTYKREHQVVAWARHMLPRGKVLQVCAIPEGDAFGVYLCVERVIDGQTVQMVERLADRAESGGDPREHVGLDCSLTYDGRNTTATTITLAGGATAGSEVTVTASASTFSLSNVGDQVVIDYDGTPCRITIEAYDSAAVVRGTASRPLVAADLSPGTAWALAVDTLSGLEHLEGEEVQVAADGFDLGLYTVESATVRPRQPVVLAHVGIPFNADFESLDMAVVGGASVANRSKVIKSVGVLVKDTQTISASSTGFDRMERFKGRDSGQSMSVPPAWRTEWLDPPLNVDGAWKRNPRVYIRAPGPYGATVLAIEPQFDIGAG